MAMMSPLFERWSALRDIGPSLVASLAIHAVAVVAVTTAFALAPPLTDLNRPVVEVQIAASFQAPSPAPRDAPNAHDAAPSLGNLSSHSSASEDQPHISEIAVDALETTTTHIQIAEQGAANQAGAGFNTESAQRGGVAIGEVGPSRTAHSAGVRPDPYAYAVSAWIERHKRMPHGARQWVGERTVVVAFTLDPRGRMSRAFVVRGSGDARLDAATLQLLNEIAPFPRAGDAAWSRRRFEVPVSYSWR